MNTAMAQGSRARAARLVFSVLLAAAALGACSIVVDLDGLSEGAKPDAGATGGGGECARAVAPSRPPGGGDDGTQELVVALRKIDLGEKAPDDAPIGLDLDRMCTCEGEGPSCVQPYFAKDARCDDKGGIDNSSAKAFKTLIAVAGDSVGSTFYSEQAEKGEWSLILHVAAYNGQADDDRVTVSLYESPGMAAGGSPAPAWGGSDVWPISSTSVTDGMTVSLPVFVDVNGYVAGHVLVAELPAFLIRLKGPESNFRLDIERVTLVGLIESPPDGLGPRVTKGVIGGITSTKKVFAGMSVFKANGLALCKGDDVIYGQFRGLMCSYVDISLTPNDTSAECDSISVGMMFETFPAKMGTVVTVAPEAPSCPPEKDPANDTCG